MTNKLYLVMMLALVGSLTWGSEFAIQTDTAKSTKIETQNNKVTATNVLPGETDIELKNFESETQKQITGLENTIKGNNTNINATKEDIINSQKQIKQLTTENLILQKLLKISGEASLKREMEVQTLQLINITTDFSSAYKAETELKSLIDDAKKQADDLSKYSENAVNGTKPEKTGIEDLMQKIASTYGYDLKTIREAATNAADLEGNAISDFMKNEYKVSGVVQEEGK
ncbi:MAG: hypothetical protein UR26_C0003G0093 [candidate division TM6 bacterium GW2011_GWF2_32_72]|nr:MAG: hypothetical protein UR26_C0003G0093 [candidate division TM6 bacterium GW2011_GWF2_32_72]